MTQKVAAWVYSVLFFLLCCSLLRLDSPLLLVDGACYDNCTTYTYPTNGPYYVSVGVLVTAVNSLDREESTVRFDAYIWLRWPICTKDLDDQLFRPDLTMELDNAINRVDVTVRPFLSEPVCDSVNGTVYQQFRVEGQFLQHFDFRRYPLDTHSLTVKIEDTFYPRSVLVYVPDDIQPSSTLTDSVNLPGWSVKDLDLTELVNVYDTVWGSENPAYSYNVYSNFHASITISRGVTVYILRVLPPVVVTILIIAIVFLLEIEETEARISVIAGGLLAMIFLQLTFSANLPSSIDYLTVVDWLFNSMYMLILGVLIEAVVIRWIYHWLARRDQRKVEARQKEEEEEQKEEELRTISSSATLSTLREIAKNGDKASPPSENRKGEENATETEEEEEEEEEEEDEAKRRKRKVTRILSGGLAGKKLNNKKKKQQQQQKQRQQQQAKKVKMIHDILQRVEKWLFFIFIMIVVLDVTLVTVIARYA